MQGDGSRNELITARLFSSKGPDGLSRMDRERRCMTNYNRNDFLFERFLNHRKKQETLQLHHEHILDVGDIVMRKLEHRARSGSAKHVEDKVQIEMDRLQQEAELFKSELKRLFMKKFEEDRENMKKVSLRIT
jgi:hypothetical protein